MRALPVQNPFAELILRGLKSVGYRSRPTNIRERVFLYATKNAPDPDEAAARVREDYGIDLDVAGLPRGVLVGTVEIVGCRPSKRRGVFEWLLARPERLAKPQAPKKMPCSGGFFNPF